MRLHLGVLALVLLGCAKEEQSAADTTAMAMGPAALAEADVAGTWTGTMKADGSDSVIVHWTQVCASGACQGTATEMPGVTIPSTYAIGADSAMGKTSPYKDATLGGANVIDNWVLRLSGPGKITGRGWIVLAERPDSVLLRYSFEGSRAP